jgi:hypothetical protein
MKIKINIRSVSVRFGNILSDEGFFIPVTNNVVDGIWKFQSIKQCQRFVKRRYKTDTNVEIYGGDNSQYYETFTNKLIQQVSNGELDMTGFRKMLDDRYCGLPKP